MTPAVPCHRSVETVVRHLWDKRMSSVKTGFGIVNSDARALSNFRPFSYPIGSAISALRTARYAANATPIGLRSGLPAPLNRPGRNSRPALLPGPAAPLSFACQAGSFAAAEAAVSRRWFGERRWKRPSRSLASNKRHIRYFGRYRAFPEAPVSKPPDRICLIDGPVVSPRLRTCPPDRRGAEAGAKRHTLEQER